MIKLQQSEKEYLKRCKNSSAESKLNWLASALEFGKIKKRKNKTTLPPKKN